ncbi:MAG TPA: methylthioribulose 1-phosphate dehydratase [Actinobacteria bacterium]|jgi:methylthioribulose-1-phosphate dehydratase|nr:methylthioribulose 1-phosphate dehydratase [Actinomycetota bacterium]
MSLEHGRAVRLAATTRHLYDLGWMRGTSGNVSVVAQEDPRHLLVSASGIAKHATQPEHAVITDAMGQALEGQSHAPSAEAPVHAAIVDVSGARSVVHVHAMSSVLAAARWPSGVALTGVEQMKGLGCSAEGDVYTVPVVENSQDMAVLSERIRRALNPAVPVVLVADHGMYVWGASLDDAANRTESADWLLQHALLLDLVAPPGRRP